jgi:hypothetical protein
MVTTTTTTTTTYGKRSITCKVPEILLPAVLSAVQVALKVRCQTRMGQRVAVVKSRPSFGSTDANQAQPPQHKQEKRHAAAAAAEQAAAAKLQEPMVTKVGIVSMMYANGCRMPLSALITPLCKG